MTYRDPQTPENAQLEADAKQVYELVADVSCKTSFIACSRYRHRPKQIAHARAELVALLTQALDIIAPKPAAPAQTPPATPPTQG